MVIEVEYKRRTRIKKFTITISRSFCAFFYLKNHIGLIMGEGGVTVGEGGVSDCW